MPEIMDTNHLHDKFLIIINTRVLFHESSIVKPFYETVRSWTQYYKEYGNSKIIQWKIR